MTQPFVGTHTESGWRDWHLENVELTAEGVRLATGNLPTYLSPDPVVESLPGNDRVVDVAIEPCGDVLVLSTSGFVFRYDTSADRFSRLPCVLGDGLDAPRAIEVVGETIYVAEGETVDGAGDGRIHSISRPLLQRRFTRSRDVSNPVALAPTGSGVAVLDARSGDDGALLSLSRTGGLHVVETGFSDPIDLAIDRDGNAYVLSTTDDDASGPGITRIPADVVSAGEPVAGSSGAVDAPASDGDGSSDAVEVLVPPASFDPGSSGVESDLHRIEADRDGELFVAVDADEPRPVYRRRPADGSFESLDGEVPPVGRLVHDDCGAGTLYAVTAVAGGEGSDDLDAGSDDPPLLALHGARANSTNPETDRYDARLVRRLDAGVERCQWHRLTLDYEGEGGATQVRVRYYATDGPGEPIGVEVVDGIGPVFGARLRSEGVATLQSLSALDATTIAAYASTDSFTVPPSWASSWIEDAEAELADGDHVDWQRLQVTDPSDALVPDETGRYLWLRIELIGGRFESPTLESARAYFPRQSYLRYLPAVYSEEADGQFLESYLAAFESVFVDVSEAIDSATRYVDPDGVPDEAVPWLERWFALESDETWPTAARRDLIRWAPLLARHRGTRAGLLATIWLFLQEPPEEPDSWEWAREREREWLEARRAAGTLSEATAEMLLDAIGRSVFVVEHGDIACVDDDTVRSIYERIVPCEQCFGVFTTPSLGDQRLETVERIVRSQRPAHANASTIRLRPWMQLSGDEPTATHRTFLGVNSALADREYVLETSELGTDAVLGSVEADGQLGRRARLGTDTRIS